MGKHVKVFKKQRSISKNGGEEEIFKNRNSNFQNNAKKFYLYVKKRSKNFLRKY